MPIVFQWVLSGPQRRDGNGQRPIPLTCMFQPQRRITQHLCPDISGDGTGGSGDVIGGSGGEAGDAGGFASGQDGAGDGEDRGSGGFGNGFDADGGVGGDGIGDSGGGLNIIGWHSGSNR